MTFETIVQKILTRTAASNPILVGIAGPPASGKSALAQRLKEALQNAALVPMDGFHYDNAVLDELGLRDRKGAPETFDFAGFQTALNRIRTREEHVAVPLFDRNLDLSRAGAAVIRKDTQIVISEGNYLLLDETPWRNLKQVFDFTIFLDVPPQELERRLRQRWKQHHWPDEKADLWIKNNDLPNAVRVLSSRVPADIVVSEDDLHR